MAMAHEIASSLLRRFLEGRDRNFLWPFLWFLPAAFASIGQWRSNDERAHAEEKLRIVLEFLVLEQKGVTPEAFPMSLQRCPKILLLEEIDDAQDDL